MPDGNPDNNEVGLPAAVHHLEQQQGQPELNNNPGPPNNPAAVSIFTTILYFVSLMNFTFWILYLSMFTF